MDYVILCNNIIWLSVVVWLPKLAHDHNLIGKWAWVTFRSDMAARQEEDVYLQVKKYTFLGASGCQDKAITDLFLQKLKDSTDEEESEDSVKWLRVERLKKDGECVVVEKIYERPQNVHTHIRSKRDSDCSFQYLIDAEDLMEEVDPKLHASALVTGLGAYIIAFPLDSLVEDVPETSKMDLVREIYDSVSVIKESASVLLEPEDQKPQVILLGIHKDTVDSTEVARRQQVASDLLRRELLADEGNCNFIYPPGSGIVWAHDMSKYSSLLGVLAENVAEVEILLRHSWIEAYVSSGDTPKAKKLSKPVSKERYKRDIEKKLKVKMTAEELEELLHAYHVLGWLVTHKESVFSQAYLCKVIRCLPNKKGRIDDKKIGMMLADKGLAVKFVGEQFIVPSVLKKYTAIPRRSAAPFYLALVRGHHHIIPISISAFWRMVNTVLEEKPWDCDFPNYCNYIGLQYRETYCVHVSFVGGVIEVSVEKPLQVEGPQARIVKGFAEKCQEIQKSLSDALIEIVGQERGRVKWGFACEEDHLIEDPSSRCVSVTACDAFQPDEYLFVCPRDQSITQH